MNLVEDIRSQIMWNHIATGAILWLLVLLPIFDFDSWTGLGAFLVCVFAGFLIGRFAAKNKRWIKRGLMDMLEEAEFLSQGHSKEATLEHGQLPTLRTEHLAGYQEKITQVRRALESLE